MSKNDVTGDELRSKHNSDKYRDNYSAIFGKKKCAVKNVVNCSDSNTKSSK